VQIRIKSSSSRQFDTKLCVYLIFVKRFYGGSRRSGTISFIFLVTTILSSDFTGGQAGVEGRSDGIKNFTVKFDSEMKHVFQ